MKTMKVKYGIRHDKGKIIALSEFQKGIKKIPSEFVEISKADYNKFLAFMAKNLCCVYDAKKHEMIAQPERKEALQKTIKLESYLTQLLGLRLDIDLAQAIGDDPAGMKLKFEKLKKEYQELKRE